MKVSLGQTEKKQSSLCEILPAFSQPQQQKEYWEWMVVIQQEVIGLNIILNSI